MDSITALSLDTAVSTEGTNWEFLGEPSHPSWENTLTGHILLIDESEADGFDYRIRLNHEKQARPWWTVTEEQTTENLIPMLEWLLSAPEADLFHRELMVMILEPFWDGASPSENVPDDSSSSPA